MSLLVLALLAAQAIAPGDQVTFDIHCMIAAQTAHEQADGAMKAATLPLDHVLFRPGRLGPA